MLHKYYQRAITAPKRVLTITDPSSNGIWDTGAPGAEPKLAAAEVAALNSALNFWIKYNVRQ